MGRIRHTELAALRERWHPRWVTVFGGERIGHGAKQVADQVIQFAIGDQVRSLLIEQRTTEHAGEPHDGEASAGQAVRLIVRADQLTLNTECGGLQRDKIDVLESSSVHSLAKHDCESSLPSR